MSAARHRGGRRRRHNDLPFGDLADGLHEPIGCLQLAEVSVRAGTQGALRAAVIVHEAQDKEARLRTCCEHLGHGGDREPVGPAEADEDDVSSAQLTCEADRLVRGAQLDPGELDAGFAAQERHQTKPEDAVLVTDADTHVLHGDHPSPLV